MKPRNYPVYQADKCTRHKRTRHIEKQLGGADAPHPFLHGANHQNRYARHEGILKIPAEKESEHGCRNKLPDVTLKLARLFL